MPWPFNERLQIETLAKRVMENTVHYFKQSHLKMGKLQDQSLQTNHLLLHLLVFYLRLLCQFRTILHLLLFLNDSGSQLSSITESAVQRMHLKRQKQSLRVNSIGNVSRTNNSGSVISRLKPKNGTNSINVHAFVLPSLTHLFPNRSFEMYSQFHMRTIDSF